MPPEQSEPAVEKRHAGTLAVIAVMACLAVVGAVGGTYFANRNASPLPDPTPTVTGSSESPQPSASPSDSADPATSTEPSASPRPAEPGTYQINEVVYDALSLSVTLVSAEVTGDKLKLNFRYRNDALIAWPLTCPVAEIDRISSKVVVGDDQTVYAESSWCATTRAGETFNLAPGTQAMSWALYPVVPGAGAPFDVTWYDFPVVEDVRLR
ncbi:hypothetical protein [Micromonospora sp. NBRC 101691]|uniref:hypothetical protein n=1 Tax=Micromonospora sp. NBRC 101691 TaxID=3032198 RepID=UPI002553AD17|nr:hypothetical protein [Micromonospora sp. NBRC 101691]